MEHRFTLFLRYIIPLGLGLFFFREGRAQYFYHDIVLTMQNQQQQQLYKKNRISRVKLLSYEANGQPTTDFTCEVTLNRDYRQTETFTQSAGAGASLLTSFFDAGGRPHHTIDSSAEVVNEYNYHFDATDRLSEAQSLSRSVSGKTRETEIHVWTYGQNGCPDRMLRIKNDTDTTIVQFICDNQGNVIEEDNQRHQTVNGKIYYYYDSLNRITDIVRYNLRAGRLLPDYMFEYDDKGRLEQMIVTQQGENDYLIWKYQYEENGLRKNAICLNKQKKIAGRIEYQYSTQSAQQ